jgi:hypothetical protein
MAVQSITGALGLLLVATATVAAQDSGPDRAFGIVDNSFFVEEAFNQDIGTFQNILTADVRRDGTFDLAFTQEWPVASTDHQFSYAIPFRRLDGRSGLADVMVSYRYQAWMEAPGRPAFAPRISLLLPTGAEADGLGAGVSGLQLNLPFSRQRRSVYLHGNAGFTWHPEADTFTPHVGSSAIWNWKPLFNVMIEALAEFEDAGSIGLVAPGIRTGWNIGETQVVLGVAWPVTFADDTTASLLLYLSYELPFR